MLAVQPYWVERILSGVKTVEVRRRRPSARPDVVWLYETAPTCRVVGRAECVHVAADSPKGLWARYGSYTCMGREEFMVYACGVSTVYGLLLGEVSRVDGLELSRFGLRRAPQSFAYVRGPVDGGVDGAGAGVVG